MVSTRAAETHERRTWSTLERPTAPALAPAAPPSPFAPLGFPPGDRFVAAPRPPRALGPLAGPARAAAGDAALALAARGRLQQIHQAERRAEARSSRARLDPPPARPAQPAPAEPATVKVGGKTYRHGQGDRLWLNLAARGRSYEKWAKRHPEAARLVGRPTRVYREIRTLRHDFQRVGSPLAKYARHFVTAGHLSGYHPRFIAAFAALESGWGRSTPRNAPHNYWGWSVYTGQQSSAVASPFQRPGQAFRYFGRELGKHYGGAKSAYSRVWAPYAADPNHERSIAQIMRDQFRGDPNDIRFPKRLRDR